MILSPLRFDAVKYVADHMREQDRNEIFATRWNDSTDDVANDCLAAGRFGWVAGLDWPIAVVGAVPCHPGAWSVYMFATDNFTKIAKSLTKFVKFTMIPALADTGAHRAECCSLVGHTQAHKWLKILGARQEGPEFVFGRNREKFVRFVWDRDHD